VLKVVGLEQAPISTYKQQDPICLTDDQRVGSLFVGFPYPSTNPADACSNILNGKAFTFFPSYTDASNLPGNFNCSDALDSPYWTYWGGACEGTLGGPMIAFGSNDFFGILTYFSTSCSDTSHSRVGFSAITNGGTAWGFAVSKMVAAIP
jgi:hypothetical protein